MLAASTGVIGVVLDDAQDRRRAAADGAGAGRLAGKRPRDHDDRHLRQGRGRDLRRSTASKVSLAGIAKGSGMIAPNMATMLAFVFTDAALSAPILKTLLRAETETSFNSITVDGDRSTNDCVLLFATGQAKVAPIADAKDARLDDFRAALSATCCADLAIQIVRDGEGATKLVTVNVEGAANDASAKIIARTICESPLVKTAIAGEDANWGRIVMAIGRADQPIRSAT